MFSGANPCPTTINFCPTLPSLSLRSTVGTTVKRCSGLTEVTENGLIAWIKWEPAPDGGITKEVWNDPIESADSPEITGILS